MNIETVHTNYSARLQKLLQEMTAAFSEELPKQRITDLQVSFDISIQMHRDGGYVDRLMLTHSAIKLEITR